MLNANASANANANESVSANANANANDDDDDDDCLLAFLNRSSDCCGCRNILRLKPSYLIKS